MLEDFDRVFQGWWDKTNQPLVVFGGLGIMLVWLYLTNVKEMRFIEAISFFANLGAVVASLLWFVGLILFFVTPDIGKSTFIFGSVMWIISAFFYILTKTFDPNSSSTQTRPGKRSFLDDTGGKGYDGFNDGGGD